MIYVIENHKLAEYNVRGDVDRMETSVAHTQIHDNFFVKQTESIEDTLGYLSVFTFQIENIYQKKRVIAIGGDISSRNELEQLRENFHKTTGVRYHITYQVFDRMNGKEKNLSQKDMFLKQLIQIRNIGLDKALAITEVYPTMKSLIDAYDRRVFNKEKEELLTNLTFGPQKRKIGSQVSKKLYQLYCLDDYDED